MRILSRRRQRDGVIFRALIINDDLNATAPRTIRSELNNHLSLSHIGFLVYIHGEELTNGAPIIVRRYDFDLTMTTEKALFASCLNAKQCVLWHNYVRIHRIKHLNFSLMFILDGA